ncbi:hypothetical protein GCM10010505_43690 [Kitasatospora aburaviensis]
MRASHRTTRTSPPPAPGGGLVALKRGETSPLPMTGGTRPLPPEYACRVGG